MKWQIRQRGGARSGAVSASCASGILSLAAFAVWFSAATAFADVTFSLAPTSDLSQLKLGDVATINVVLSGVPSGPNLQFASATANFDSTLLTATSMQPGSIVPNGGADYLGMTDVGLVDAFFDTSSTQVADLIASDGVFYSFDVRALQLGAGTIDLSFWMATGFDLNDPVGVPVDAIAGSGLAFTVVPEPGSLMLLLAGIVGV
jgi:hypothetical protein